MDIFRMKKSSLIKGLVRLCPKMVKILIFGLSALAVVAYGFTLVRVSVRPSVRHTISGDPRIRF